MMVEARCKDCHHYFSAHWNDWRKEDGCPKCGSKNIRTWNDEANDPPDDFELEFEDE